MEWKSFAQEYPEVGRLILYGNHRYVDTMLYNPTHKAMKEDAKIGYKNITYWCYIDPPPVVEWKSEWS